MNTNELWLPLPGYESWYEISSLGRLRSLPRVVTQRKGPDGRLFQRKLRAKMRRPGGRKYRHFTLCTDNGRKRCLTAHSLVALAFLGPCPVGCEVNHKDGDKHNNRADNLEYTTPSGNQTHAADTGLMRTGDRHHRATVTPDQVREVRRQLEVYSGHGCCVSIGRAMGISPRVVQHIKDGETWKQARD